MSDSEALEIFGRVAVAIWPRFSRNSSKASRGTVAQTAGLRRQNGPRRFEMASGGGAGRKGSTQSEISVAWRS